MAMCCVLQITFAKVSEFYQRASSDLWTVQPGSFIEAFTSEKSDMVLMSGGCCPLVEGLRDPYILACYISQVVEHKRICQLSVRQASSYLSS